MQAIPGLFLVLLPGKFETHPKGITLITAPHLACMQTRAYVMTQKEMHENFQTSSWCSCKMTDLFMV